MMEISSLWSVALTAALGFVAWWGKGQQDELSRLRTLLNRTREEMAKEYVTKTDSNQVLLQIMSKFDRLEEKIDRLMER
jgi:glycogen debranching enzyme